MDFASLMSAQIAKTQSKSVTSTPSNTKYLRRSDAESKREQAYLAEQASREAEKISKAEKKRQSEDEEAEKNRAREAKRQRLAEESRQRRLEEEQKEERERRKRLGLPELPEESRNGDKQDGDGLQADDIPDEDLIIKLREMEEPARLFGESHKQRLKRYHKIQTDRSRSSTPNNSLVKKEGDGPISTSLEPVPEAEMKVSLQVAPKSDAGARLYLSRQLTSWFTLVLKEWAIALIRRDEAVKRSMSGQAATNSMAQAIAHLRPLYKKLEKLPNNPDELPDDLLAPIVEIVCAAQERRYVDANDGYLQLSIGKAAWPIGVTMVGIHERSAREKLHESDKGKAHIMADETTRKILQSIKRCLSFAQTRWPPEDIGQLMG